MTNKKGLIALSPLMVFMALYFATSTIAHDFYKIPISVAFLLSSIYAIAIFRNGSLSERIKTFSSGAGTSNVMLMIWVFILAGAFANTAKVIGCVDATVDLMLRILPDNMVLAGLFLATCFISLSIGTSVGAIVALVPIASGLAASTSTNPALMTAIVVGGAFFGDNLSFISDTTIAATNSQGCKMNDKFKANSIIAIPAAVIVLIAYVILGLGTKSPSAVQEVEYAKVIPYLAVFMTALAGMNVMLVLCIGMGLCGVIGLVYGSFDVYGWFGAMGDGIMSMGELIIITMLAGGLFETVRANGGINYIMERITIHIHGRRGAEAVIGLMVSAIDICTANNTVAIITVGGIAKRISDKYGVDKRKAASILDTFSCFMQGIIPYGAQMLMAASLTRLSPPSITPYLFYPYTLGVLAILAIFLRFPKKYS